MDPFQKFKAGDQLRLSAELQNLTVDTVQAYLRDRGDIRGGRATRGQVVELLIRNNSGADLNQFAIVGIGTPLVYPGDDDETFFGPLVYDSDEPVTGQPFAVLQLNTYSSTIGSGSGSGSGVPGNMVPAIAAGLTLVKVDVQDITDTWADAVTNDYDKLRSQGNPARAEILWPRPFDDIGEKWALVNISTDVPDEPTPPDKRVRCIDGFLKWAISYDGQSYFALDDLGCVPCGCGSGTGPGVCSSCVPISTCINVFRSGVLADGPDPVPCCVLLADRTSTSDDTSAAWEPDSDWICVPPTALGHTAAMTCSVNQATQLPKYTLTFGGTAFKGGLCAVYESLDGQDFGDDCTLPVQFAKVTDNHCTADMAAEWPDFLTLVPYDNCDACTGSGSGSGGGGGTGGNCCLSPCDPGQNPHLVATVTNATGCFEDLPSTIDFECVTTLSIEHNWDSLTNLSAACGMAGNQGVFNIACPTATTLRLRIFKSPLITNTNAETGYTCSPLTAVFHVNDGAGNTFTLTVVQV